MKRVRTRHRAVLTAMTARHCCSRMPALRRIGAVLVLFCLAWLYGTGQALAESASKVLASASEAVGAASTLNEQLALLYDLSFVCAAELENGGWNTGLTLAPAQPFPEDLLPAEDMEESELTPADFEGSKFIAIYDDQGDYRLLGDFQVRIPEAMRAVSLEEADAVLCLVHTTRARSDYTGPADNRLYCAYIYHRGSGVCVKVYHALTTPPVTGTGPLSGEHLSLAELWNGVRPWFYGVIELAYPEGTASYRITGRSCCLTGLSGAFVRYEIPSEVQGHPVTGIEAVNSDTLEELTVPEGVVWIRSVKGKNLRRMNFPSTLRRIEDYVSRDLEEAVLNEGLEEISDFSLLYGCGEAFTLPSTLKKLGRGSLEYGVDCPFLVIPDGITKLPDYFLSSKGKALCVYIPAGVTSFGTDLLDRGTVLIYTPEGSRASAWATSMGYEWIACASPEDMPKPRYAEDGGFEYAVVEGEAVLAGYSGGEACVRIPEVLGDCPVTVVRSYAFNNNGTMRAVLFPETVRRTEGSAVFRCRALEAAFVPASVANFHLQTVFDCGDVVVYAAPGSATEQKLQDSSHPSCEMWTPGLENDWFRESR